MIMDDNPIIKAWEASNDCNKGPGIRQQFIAYLQRRYGANLRIFLSTAKEAATDVQCSTDKTARD